MDARWFVCSFLAAVLFTAAQSQVIGRMRHVASPGPESCNTLDDLMALLSLARALEEKSTGRLCGTYCPDDVIINLVNALVYTATAHVCPEPWTPTPLPPSYPPHPQATTYPPGTQQPTTTYPSTTTHPVSTYSPTSTYPPSSNEPYTSTVTSPSNTSDNEIEPIDNGDHNQNGILVGVNENAQIQLFDVDGNHHSGDDKSGKNHKISDDGGKSHKGGDKDENLQPVNDGSNTPKGTEDTDYSQYAFDIGESKRLDFDVQENKMKRKMLGDGKEPRPSIL